MKKLALGAALGVLISLFLDPRSGKRRRRQLWSRAAGLYRHALRSTRSAARGVAADAVGFSRKAAHLREQPKPQPNDATLVAKVESEVLRGGDMPKGSININAENGIVVLRGQVESQDLIEELVKKVHKVQGVQGVENLLHLPGTEAPMHGAHPA
jgi:osmotically-inducible protein OsmY